MTRVSVIIPVYNAAPWLGACLDSALGQTLRDIEVICVDDGSTDDSAAILAARSKADSRIKVLTQANRGLGAARNRGLEIARGEYVHFLDADDALADSSVLERLVGEAERERLDALFFDAETRIDGNLDVPPTVARAEAYVRRHDYSGLRTGRALFADFIENREYTPNAYLVLLHRTFLERSEIRFPDERIFHEDNIFMVRVMLAANRVSHRPWRCYVRMVHEGSIVTSRPTLCHLRGYLACYADITPLLSDGGWDKRTRAALLDRIAVYKLHIRRMVDADHALASEAREKMSDEEYAKLQAVLVYPFREKVANAVRCFKENGFIHTLKRILFGRQSMGRAHSQKDR